jgi:hypothetical protein
VASDPALFSTVEYGSEVRNMKILIAALTAVLMLAFAELSLGARDAEAAYYSENYCKNRYNLCLARCPDRVRCFSRCLTQYRYCTPPAPALGDLL